MDFSISIIIPVYQAEKTLSRCLDSVLNQSFQNFKVFLVDDGSTDHTASILRTYAKQDNRLSVFHKENGGAASARNFALAQINSMYVTFLDADDWWEKDALLLLYETAQKTNADIVQCKFQYDSPNGHSYLPLDTFSHGTVLEQKDFPKTIYRKMMTGMQLNHVHHTLYRTSLLQGITMPEHMRTGEDLMFNIEVYPRAQRYAYCAIPAYHYYRRPDGLTGSSLSIRDKFYYNWQISKNISKSLPAWNMDKPWYHLWAYLRPISLGISKLYRMLRNAMMYILPTRKE